MKNPNDTSTPLARVAAPAAEAKPFSSATETATQRYDRDVFDIVYWAQRGGWLCCQDCGAYGPYTMVQGRALCHACLREGSSRLFTAAEHNASEREARR